MAVVAHFKSDFTDFVAGVQKAEVSLKAFQAGASDVESGLKRMGNSFSGVKITQDALLMAKAIHDAGGASTLTAKELARVSATVNEATEKLQALGKAVPASISALKTEVDAASRATGGWLPLLRELGSSWAVRVAEGVLLRDAIRGVLSEMKALAVALPEIALKGAAVADVEENFKRLAEQAGHLGDTLLGTLREGTHNTITNFELMKTANQDLAAGMNLTDQQFGTLAKGAFALAQATGTDVKTAFDTMNDAMLTGRTRALALLTGKIDLSAAEDKYAKSLGTTAEHLSDAGKLEAARVGILDSVAAATTRLGEQTDGLDERVAQAQTSWVNFTEDLGKAIATSDVLGVGLSGLQTALQDAFGGGQTTLIQAVTKAIDSAAIATIDLAVVGVDAAGALVKGWFALEKVFGNVAQVIDGVRLSYLLVQQAASIGLFPGITGDIQRWKELDGQIEKLEITMMRRGAALQEDSRQQAAVDTTTAKYVKTLEDLKGKMSAARDSTATATIATTQLAGAQTAGAAAAGRHAGLIKQTAGEIAKAAKEIEAAAAAEAKAYEVTRESIGKSRTATLQATDAFKGVILTWEQSLNLAKGFTHDGLLPMAAGYDDTARAARVAKNAGDELKRGNESIQSAILTTTETGVTGFRQMGKAIEDATKATGGATTGLQTLSGALGTLSNDFAQMAQIGGDSFSQIARDIGLSIKAAEALSNALQMSGIGGPKGGEAGKAGSGVGSAVAGAGISGAGLGAAAAVGNTLAIASAWVAVGVAVYSVISSISKAAEEAAHAEQKLARLLGLAKQFGASSMFSGSLGDAVEATNTRLDEMATKTFALTGVFKGFTDYFGRLHDLSASLNLPEVIKELGGVSALTGDQVKIMGHHFENLFGLIEVGGPLAVDATKAMDDGLVAFGQAAIKAGGFVSKVFADTIAQAQAAGTELAGVGEFLKGQFGQAATGLTAVFGGMEASATAAYIASAVKAGASIEAATKAAEEAGSHWVLTSQEQATGLGMTVAATFGGLLANGASLREALGAIGEPLATLTDALNTAGLSGGQAFDFLNQMADIASDKMTGPLVDAIEGARSSLLGLGNTGRLNQEMFGALSGTATEAYNEIIKQGKSADAAMSIMQPTLQTLWEGQERFGFKTDAATQALIDQGVASGTVGAQFVGAQDKMQMAMDRTNVILEAIGKALGATIPDAMKTMGTTATEQAAIIAGKDGLAKVTAALNDGSEDWATWGTAAEDAAKGAQSALDGISAPTIDDISFTINGMWKIPDQPAMDPSWASQGGRVTASGIVYAAEGANLLKFAPRGTDTVPAMLTPGERVLSVAQNKDYEANKAGGTVVDFDAYAQRMEDKQDALQRKLEDVIRSLPKMNAIAVRDAIQKGRGR